MKKIGKMILASLCVTMLMTVQLMAAGTTTFSGTGKQEGNNLEVSVTVKDANAFSGEVTMEYDPAVVRLTGATAGEAVEGKVTSVNTQESGVVTIGFADLTAVQVGEILNVEFEVVGSEPAGGFVFAIDATEWSGENRNDEATNASNSDYQIIVKKGTATITPGGPSNTGTSNTGSGKVDTGDDTNFAPYVVLVIVACVAVAGACVVLIRKRKTTTEK